MEPNSNPFDDALKRMQEQYLQRMLYGYSLSPLVKKNEPEQEVIDKFVHDCEIFANYHGVEWR